MFENKIKFTEDEQSVFGLLKDNGILYDAGNKEHKRLKSTIGNLFIKGFIDRGDKALNHFVLSGLGKKAISYNEFVDLFKKQ